MGVDLRTWLRDRTSVDSGPGEGLNRGLPKSVGWWNTLGAVAVALLLVEMVTGIFLAMYYSPHPDAAYETTRFIDYELVMGRLVHGIHRYGESALVVVLFLHLLRTYFQGAYKAPRELVWITGVLVFLLTLGFGFTGSLLPWDQNAYNATQVRTKYAADMPVIGPILQLLLRGGTNVGAMTLTRFYAIHALLLPALLVPLLIVHIGLAWRKGPTPTNSPVGEEPPHTHRYLDHHLVRDAVAMFVAVGLVVGWALLQPLELEFKANPADPTYHPHAEWYFMWLLQLVSDFGSLPGMGGLTWLPVAVVPGIAVTFLMLAPWIDRGRERRASRRPVMMGALALGLLGVLGMSFRAYSTMRVNATPSNSLQGVFTQRGERELDPELVAQGRTAFAACGGCHAAYQDFTGKKAGPDLTGYGLKTFLEEVKGVPTAEVRRLSFYDRYAGYVRGTLRPPDSRMPKYSEEALPKERLDAIAAYISQDPAAVAILEHQDPKAAPQGE